MLCACSPLALASLRLSSRTCPCVRQSLLVATTAQPARRGFTRWRIAVRVCREAEATVSSTNLDRRHEKAAADTALRFQRSAKVDDVALEDARRLVHTVGHVSRWLPRAREAVS